MTALLEVQVNAPLNAHLNTLSNTHSNTHSNTQGLTELHQALVAVHEMVGNLTLSGCDQDDIFELIDRAQAELAAAQPHVQIVATCLNSIARSLRNQPEAREACLRIENVMERTGLPSTWQAGI